MGHIAEENSPPAAYIKQPHSSYHKSTLTAPSRTMGRRVSITSPVSSPEHILTGTSGRKLPQPPSADSPTTGTISPHHHNRRESAPAPLPRPFRATIAPQTQLFAASKSPTVSQPSTECSIQAYVPASISYVWTLIISYEF